MPNADGHAIIGRMDRTEDQLRTRNTNGWYDDIVWLLDQLQVKDREARDEREACAKIAEGMASPRPETGFSSEERLRAEYNYACHDIARAIRARSDRPAAPTTSTTEATP